MPVQETSITPVKVQPSAPRGTAGARPIRTLERFADEVTRVFDDFGLGRVWNTPPASADLLTWVPRVDVTQHLDELVLRADLPGLEKEEVKLSVTEDAVTIRGERHRAQDEERDTVYRSERGYGVFSRTIGLPAGAITDQAKASFKNGILEIRMPASPGVTGRPVEIAG